MYQVHATNKQTNAFTQRNNLHMAEPIHVIFVWLKVSIKRKHGVNKTRYITLEVDL